MLYCSHQLCKNHILKALEFFFFSSVCSKPKQFKTLLNSYNNPSKYLLITVKLFLKQSFFSFKNALEKNNKQFIKL